MKKFLTLAFVLMMTFCMTVTAFASTEIGSGVATETGGHQTSNQDNRFDSVSPEDILDLSPVTTEDLQNKIDQKGGDIIAIIARVCRYICMAAFPLGCIMILLGFFGNKKMLAAGVFMAIFAGIGYAAITCSPEIVHFVASWAAS